MSTPITLITGASRGLGRNAAIHLARHGHDLIITYNSGKEAAEAVVAQVRELGVKAVALQLDVGRSSSFVSFAEQVRQTLAEVWQCDSFDALVNNAGIGINVPFAETTEEQFDLLMNIHLKGTYFLTQRLLPLLADGGHILNISSGLARFSMPGYSAYAAMKGGVEVLTRFLATELGPRRIRVNTIAPGAIETDFGGGVVRDNRQINAAIAAQTALGRVGVPDDIGKAIAMLLSEESCWVNAQRLEVSGGIYS
ncbi:SDR family NAD(P)-dependent oxidoreductase [Pseudomonas sp. NCCP-436]|uniref:SDR family NAD(P)-dependent oxidoreductase n=1 Tax=Pseudomonas sp. NCCP-436 TaxID=2842481 RepID=UPI001C7E93D3|nr:SDR family oxidoreductase [Pseudomonas sp. NCCP-436]GIZ13766.1 short-chain dehydrogenase [Pseudomonas sp. NCCP-436]